MPHPEQNPFNSAVASFLRKKKKEGGEKKQEESCSEISHCGVAPFKVHENRLNNREVREVYKVVHIRTVGDRDESCRGLHVQEPNGHY